MSDATDVAAGSNAAIDWAQLDELAQIQLPGQPSLRDKLVGLYLQTSQPLIRQLEAAVGRADAAAIAATAHPLKSSSANVGAKGLAALCGRLEMLARQAELSEAGALLTQIGAQYALVVAALQADARRSLAAPMPMTA